MNDYVFQCRYCGQFVPVERAIEYYQPDKPLPDGRVLVYTATYCSKFCGREATSVPVGR